MVNKVTVESAARLHLGFYNIMSENIAYGSLGVAINYPKVKVSVLRSGKVRVENKTSMKYVEEQAYRVINMLGPYNVKVVVKDAVPRHVGLGSTTQLMLSVGQGINIVHNLHYTVKELAVKLRRGIVSGIGIAAFEKGGFIVDSGRRVKGETIEPPKTVEELPQIIFRKNIPRNWLFLVIIPKGIHGLSEREEKTILATPEPAQKGIQMELWKTMLTHLLPSLARNDIAEFGKAITKIQILTGSYFAKYQGGIFCCEETEYAINSMLKHGALGAGQSSWGPTAYGIVLGLRKARRVMERTRKDMERKGYEAEYYIVNVRNNGAKVFYE